MSYLGHPFNHDIFVSYSHGRLIREGEPTFLRPWSVAFVKELDRELRGLAKYGDVRVFLDGDGRPERGVDPMAPLSDQLRNEIGASAILMVLMSEDYLASYWCQQERDWWVEQQYESDLVTERRVPTGLPAKERIAVVRIFPTDTAWPPLLTDSAGAQLVGFKFHEQISEVHRPKGWAATADDFSAAIKEDLLGIVGRIYSKLDSMKAAISARMLQQQQAESLAQAGGQIIYLHGRVEHAKVWEKAGRELADSGYVVLPGEPDAVESDPKKLQNVRAQRVETLANCDAMLLLGTDDARALDSDMVVVGKHDRQSARSRSNRLLPCGLLDTVGGHVATDIRRASARNLQTDWLDGTHPQWTNTVRRWLADKSAGASS